MIRIIYTLILALFMSIIFVESKENRCLQEGRTWNTEGQLNFLSNLTFQGCLEVYLESEEAEGFTWFGLDTARKLRNICVTFKQLKGEHSCLNCVSNDKSMGLGKDYYIVMDLGYSGKTTYLGLALAILKL